MRLTGAVNMGENQNHTFPPIFITPAAIFQSLYKSSDLNKNRMYLLKVSTRYSERYSNETGSANPPGSTRFNAL